MDKPIFIPNQVYLDYDMDNLKLLNELIEDVKKNKGLIDVKKEELKDSLNANFDDLYKKCLKMVTNERVIEAQEKDPFMFKTFIRETFSNQNYYISYFDDNTKDL